MYTEHGEEIRIPLPFIIVMIIEPSPFVAAPLYLHRIYPGGYDVE